MKDLLETFRYAKRIFNEQRWRFILIIISQGTFGVLEGFGIVLLLPLLELIQKGPSAADGSNFAVTLIANMMNTLHIPMTLLSVLISIFTIIIIQQFVYYLQQKLTFGSIYRYEAINRENLYRSIFAAKWEFFLGQKAGSLNNALTFEVSRLGQAFYILSFMTSLLVVISVYVSLAVMLSWQMMLVTLFFAAATFSILQKYISRARLYGQDITDSNTELQNEAIEQISAAKLVKGCAMEESVLTRFVGYLNSLAGAQYKSSINHALMKVLFDPISILVLLSGIYLAITFFKMSLSALIVYVFVFYRLSPRLSNLQSNQQALMTYLPAQSFIDNLRMQADNLREVSGGKVFSEIKKSIDLSSTSFSYIPGTQVLSGVDLVIPRFETVAIVGGSGAGKSTVIDLILGLLQPSGGHILIDNIDLSSYDLKSWRSKIGYVAQDTILFHASVRENILWGSGKSDDETLLDAAKLGNAEEFISNLPDGYDTEVGERGVKLSGGQRQRIALARALARRPQLLILDEATSSLDAESEKKIQEAIHSLRQKMTILIVAHRLSTIRDADLIYVLEAGKVVEKGSWQELTSSEGRFAVLKNIQGLE